MAARKKTTKKTNPDDLQQNEDERGSIPLVYPAAFEDDFGSSRTKLIKNRQLMCYGDLMGGGQMELRTGTASPFSPGLAALPVPPSLHFQSHVVVFLRLRLSTVTTADRFGAPGARGVEWGRRE
jgi:hypothetical protein